MRADRASCAGPPLQAGHGLQQGRQGPADRRLRPLRGVLRDRRPCVPRARPALAGNYLYGDFCSGKIWWTDAANPAARGLLADTNLNISSFGRDQDGNVYVVHLGGSIYRL